MNHFSSDVFIRPKREIEENSYQRLPNNPPSFQKESLEEKTSLSKDRELPPISSVPNFQIKSPPFPNTQEADPDPAPILIPHTQQSQSQAEDASNLSNSNDSSDIDSESLKYDSRTDKATKNAESQKNFSIVNVNQTTSKERLKKKSRSGLAAFKKEISLGQVNNKLELLPGKNHQLSPDSSSKGLALTFAKKRASFQLPTSYSGSPTNSMAVPPNIPCRRISVLRELQSQIALQGLHRQNTKFRRPSQRVSKQHSVGTSNKMANTLVGGFKKKTFYDVISNFYMVKKFMTILRGITSTRTPKWLNNYHFETINDICFFHSVYREQEYHNLMKEDKHKTEQIFNDQFKLYSRFKTYFIKKKRGRELLDYYEKLCEKLEKFFHVLDPSKQFILCWETLLLFCILLYFIIIPLETSFDVNFHQLALPLSYINSFTLIVFLLDILKKFNTAFYVKGALVTKRQGIALHYLKRDFWIDLLSVGSLFFKQIICEDFNFYNEEEWWVRISSLLFFLKYMELEAIIKKFEDLIFFDKSLNNKLALFKLILKILLISHLFACLWHIIGYQSQQVTNVSWLSLKGIISNPWYIRYIYSFYYVCVTMNTVGYGDITPTNIYEVVFDILLINISCAIFAYSLNSIGIIISNIMRQEDEFKNDLYTINDFMREKNINFDLRMRVRKYLEYIWHEEKIDKVENQAKIIEKLSDSLKDELLLEANGTIIRDIKMFSLNFSEDTLRQTVSIMKEVRYTPGDLIFLKDESENKALYIVRKGEVEIFLETPKSVNPVTVLKKLKEGDVFGELAFFSGNVRSACARSTDFTTVFMIRQEDFLSIIRKYNKDFEKYCEIRDNINNYHDYSDVFLKCFSCNEQSHPVKYCNLLHYTALREIVVRKHTFTNPQERKEEVRRRKKKDSNALLGLQRVETGAYELQKLIFPAHESENSSDESSDEGIEEKEEEEEESNNTIVEENEETTKMMSSQSGSPSKLEGGNNKGFKRLITAKSAFSRKLSRFSLKGKKTIVEDENKDYPTDENEQESELQINNNNENYENDEEECSEMFNRGLTQDEGRKQWGRRKSRKKNILMRKSLGRVASRKSLSYDVEDVEAFISMLNGVIGGPVKEKDREKERERHSRENSKDNYMSKDFRSLKSETYSVKSLQSPSIGSSSVKPNNSMNFFMKFMLRLVELSKQGSIQKPPVENENKDFQPDMPFMNENTLELDRIKSLDFYFSYNNIENVLAQIEMFNLMKLRRKTGKTTNKMKHLYLQNSLSQNGVPTYIRGSILVNPKNENTLIDDFIYNKNQEMLQKRQFNNHTFIRKNFFKNAPMLEKMLQEEQFDAEKIKEFYINKYMRGTTQGFLVLQFKILWNWWKKVIKFCLKRKRKNKNDKKKTTKLKVNNENVEVSKETGRGTSPKSTIKFPYSLSIKKTQKS